MHLIAQNKDCVIWVPLHIDPIDGFIWKRLLFVYLLQRPLLGLVLQLGFVKLKYLANQETK